MDSTHVMAVTFACICVAVAIGHLIRTRLDENQLSSQTQEVVKVSAGVIATLTALVIGLLISGSKHFYDDKVSELRTFVVNIGLLDRAMSRYEPTLIAERQRLDDFVNGMTLGLWGDEQAASHTDLLATLDTIRDTLRHLKPQDDAQRSLQSRMVALTDTLMVTGAQLIETDDAAIPLPLFAVLDGWLAVIFLGFAVFAPLNRVTVLAFGIAAAAISMSVFLVVEMNSPFHGFVTIPSKMMSDLRTHLAGARQAPAPTPPR